MQEGNWLPPSSLRSLHLMPALNGALFRLVSITGEVVLLSSPTPYCWSLSHPASFVLEGSDPSTFSTVSRHLPSRPSGTPGNARVQGERAAVGELSIISTNLTEAIVAPQAMQLELLQSLSLDSVL